MNVHRNNTVLQFKTKLSEVIELEGNWEVGLLEASFPGKIANVFGDKFSYTVHLTNRQSIECVMNARSVWCFRKCFVYIIGP